MYRQIALLHLVHSAFQLFDRPGNGGGDQRSHYGGKRNSTDGHEREKHNHAVLVNQFLGFHHADRGPVR